MAIMVMIIYWHSRGHLDNGDGDGDDDDDDNGDDDGDYEDDYDDNNLLAQQRIP